MKNETKQTAVEWLIEKQMDAGIGLPKEWREQAKEMEKEKLEDAYNAGIWDVGCRSISFDEYYNRNFKQQERLEEPNDKENRWEGVNMIGSPRGTLALSGSVKINSTKQN